MNKTDEDKYNKLIKRKKYYYLFVFVFPIIIGASSTTFNEEIAFIFAGIYGLIFLAWSFFLYYSNCPKCNGLFYGGSIKDRNIIMHKFFLNNECNNCGFKIEKNT